MSDLSTELYVDDMIVIAKTAEEMERVKETLAARFRIPSSFTRYFKMTSTLS